MNIKTITYACISDTGNIRTINQDNYICDGRYMDPQNGDVPSFPLAGKADNSSIRLFGVFDGMGGEDSGEVAAFLAADEAANFDFEGDPFKRIRDLCFSANDRICRYIDSHEDIFSMGTTAAMLMFTPDRIVCCNIGDSKVFRLSDDILRQISEDHLMFAPYGTKPPLSQNLGIPETELIIEPFVSECPYKNRDMYLICSDGLTDMLKAYEIEEMISDPDADLASKADRLVSEANARGGKDNTTVILIQISKD